MKTDKQTRLTSLAELIINIHPNMSVSRLNYFQTSKTKSLRPKIPYSTCLKAVKGPQLNSAICRLLQNQQTAAVFPPWDKTLLPGAELTQWQTVEAVQISASTYIHRNKQHTHTKDKPHPACISGSSRVNACNPREPLPPVCTFTFIFVGFFYHDDLLHHNHLSFVGFGKRAL